ncbi:MAG: hypothetical protein J6031_08280 [Bacteroidales bacterium]|nr:hypothetical protein [Bacteroidales bacterium]
MKKLFCGLMAIAAIGMFAACQKEGTFNPKEKIANVYEEYTSTSAWYNGVEWEEDTHNQPKALSERWIWDGNLLSKIEYPEIYEIDGVEATENYVMTFTYDGKQLVEANSEEERMVVTYDGKKLNKVDMYWGIQPNSITEPSVTYTFTYDGKKISKINVSMSDEDWKSNGSRMQKSRMIKMLTQSLLPSARDAEKLLVAAQKVAAKKGAKGSQTGELSLTWDGGNISKIVASYNGVQVATVEYTYDNKKNPYQGFVFGLVGETIPSDEIGLGFANENNITKMVMSEFGEEPEVEEYTYTYDGKWPVSVTCSNSYSDEYNRYNYSRTTYFEYK